MTRDAQQALRRTMERFTETCRFILIANYSGKIIEPIQSRCAPFRFAYLSREDHDTYLQRIVKAEDMSLSNDGLNAISPIDRIRAKVFTVSLTILIPRSSLAFNSIRCSLKPEPYRSWVDKVQLLFSQFLADPQRCNVEYSLPSRSSSVFLRFPFDSPFHSGIEDDTSLPTSRSSTICPPKRYLWKAHVINVFARYDKTLKPS